MMTNSVIRVATNTPEKMTIPSVTLLSEPAPLASMSGIAPIMVERAVINTGRRRTSEALSNASVNCRPSSRSWLANSTILLCKQDHTDAKLRQAASFFRTFTALSMGAYYSTPEGWKAIGYTGNVPSVTFAGPPQEVLDKLGLEQTVKS